MVPFLLVAAPLLCGGFALGRLYDWRRASRRRHRPVF
jgi:hypothetical protein